jgi:mercuric ion binding protein
MKAIKIFSTILTLAFLVAIGNNAMAQGEKNQKLKPGTSQITIKTSGQCEMCKVRIIKAVKSQDGIKKVKYNDQDKTVWVLYQYAKTDPAKIKAAIAKVGHDADDVKADPAAYEALPACCKKPK